MKPKKKRNNVKQQQEVNTLKKDEKKKVMENKDVFGTTATTRMKEEELTFDNSTSNIIFLHQTLETFLSDYFCKQQHLPNSFESLSSLTNDYSNFLTSSFPISFKVLKQQAFGKPHQRNISLHFLQNQSSLYLQNLLGGKPVKNNNNKQQLKEEEETKEEESNNFLFIENLLEEENNEQHIQHSTTTLKDSKKKKYIFDIKTDLKSITILNKTNVNNGGSFKEEEEENNNLLNNYYGISVQWKSQKGPIYFYFENLIDFNKFIIIIIYYSLRIKNQLIPSLKYSKLMKYSQVKREDDNKIIKEMIDDMTLTFVNINAYETFIFQINSFDFLNMKLDNTEQNNIWKWKAYLIDCKKLSRIECDTISLQNDFTKFAFTSTKSGSYQLEINIELLNNNQQQQFKSGIEGNNEGNNSTLLFKRSIPVTINPLHFMKSEAFIVAEEEFKKVVNRRAGDLIKFKLYLFDKFKNRSLVGFHSTMLKFKIFKVITINEEKIKNIIDLNNCSINYKLNEEECYIEIFISICKTGKFELQILIDNYQVNFYHENDQSYKNYKIINISPNDLDHLNNLFEMQEEEEEKEKQLKEIVMDSNTTFEFLFEAKDCYENTLIESIDFISIVKCEYNEKYLQYLSELPKSKKLTITKIVNPIDKTIQYKMYFIPEWQGQYNINIKYLKNIIHNITIKVLPDENEDIRWNELIYNYNRKILNEKKELIYRKIKSWTRFKSFRQILNEVVDRYSSSSLSSSSSIIFNIKTLENNASKEDILKVYKRVVFLIHVDQSPLLKDESKTIEEKELLTEELNAVFNEVQHAYKTWKKIHEL
ncbi:hypothetical protein ABK040_000999 [Willaertia magna]